MQIFNNEKYLNLYFKEQNHFAKAVKVESTHRMDLILKKNGTITSLIFYSTNSK